MLQVSPDTFPQRIHRSRTDFKPVLKGPRNHEEFGSSKEHRTAGAVATVKVGSVNNKPNHIFRTAVAGLPGLLPVSHGS